MDSLGIFDFKICKSCGESFTGDLDVCDSCYEEFQQIESSFDEKDSKYITHCKYCGRPFLNKWEIIRGGKTYYQRMPRCVYCHGKNSDHIHYGQCLYCGNKNPFDIRERKEPKVGCSKSCSNKVKNIRTENTSMKLYGVKYPMQSQEFKDRMRSTLIEKYGENYTEYIHKLQVEGVKKKFGVENVSQVPEIRKKVDETMNKRYGGYLNGSDILRERNKKRIIEKYGVEHPNQSKEVQAKRRSTNLERYGYGDWNQAPENRKKNSRIHYMKFANTISDPEKRENYIKFKENPSEYIKNLKSKPTMYELATDLGYSETSTVDYIVHDNNLSDCVDKTMFKMEQEVVYFLKSLNSDLNIIVHDRSQIDPLEIDIFLPDYNLGFECNATMTHNSTLTLDGYIRGEDLALPRNYHLEKSLKCKEKGIFLFHIFGYEWTNRQNVIESMIQNMLNKNTCTYGARNLQVVEVSDMETKKFLNENHRQGSTVSKIRLGLQTSDGELISIMTFNQIRPGIGKQNNETKDVYELSRFCNKLGSTVNGGASKLFKHFIRNYKFSKIVSFSDIAHTKGNLYKILGFDKVSTSPPNYVWVSNDEKDMYFNRVSTQKRNLPKLLGEPDLDIENQTEDQIMTSHGFVKVYDCGNIRWEYQP